ncbi:hypothetical protein NDU88_006586, partial [Pleurodeles waltl]
GATQHTPIGAQWGMKKHTQIQQSNTTHTQRSTVGHGETHTDTAEQHSTHPEEHTQHRETHTDTAEQNNTHPEEHSAAWRNTHRYIYRGATQHTPIGAQWGMEKHTQIQQGNTTHTQRST